MIGFYNYTVIVTYIGLISTFIGITHVLNGRYMLAIFCLIASGLCDMLDGVIARTHKTRSDHAKKFGIQIDSLCDVICFGVFPAIFNYAYTLNNARNYAIISVFVSSFFALTAVIRLGYFNVMEEERQRNTSEPRMSYQGMPVTMVSMFLPMLFVFKQRIEGGNLNFSIFFNVFCIILGFLYVLNIPIPKAHKKGIIVMSLLGLSIIVVLVLQYFKVISF